MSAPSRLPKRALTLKVSAQQVHKELYERSFYEFVKAAWSEIDPNPYVDNWHVKTICDHLQAVADGTADKRNLLVNVSPGTGKSIIINALFSAWLWTHSPHLKVLSLSHKEDLAIENSTKARRLIEGDWYQSYWPIKLMADQNAKGGYANNRMGVREASPIGTVTGKRANFVIVDDPHTPTETMSDTKRQSVIKAFRQTVSSRINNPKRDSVIVVMQRLHMDDVSGFILDTPELGYDHLCIPYFADGIEREPTCLGWTDEREEGEPMFADHFGDDFIERQKAMLGPYGFAGQYMQNPVPDTDGFFDVDWFHRFEPFDDPKDKPFAMNFYMTSDHASSGKGDYNVFRIWGVDQHRNIYLCDSFRKKCTFDQALGFKRSDDGKAVVLAEGALALIRKWKPLCWFAENDPTYGAFRSLIKSVKIETNTYCVIKEVPTKGSGDKVGKAQPYQAMASAGLVHLPKGEVGDEALLEYKNFPAGRHDDQVDADGLMSRMLNDTANAVIIAPTPPKKTDRWRSRKRAGEGSVDSMFW